MDHSIHPLRGARCVALSSLFAISLAGSAFSTTLQGPPSAVRVDAVREEVVLRKRPVTGDLRAIQRAEVATREKGLVMKLEVREGDAVKSGDLLAQLDSGQLTLDLAIVEAGRAPARALVVERESDVAQAERDHESLRKLVESQAANAKELDDAKSLVNASKARLLASQGQLEILEAQAKKLRQRINDMTLRAPFSGSVTRRLTEVGSWVAEGAPVVELLSTGALEVWLELPQDLFAALAGPVGSIDVTVAAAGKTFTLSSFTVIPDIDVRSRSFYIVGPVDRTLSLAAGMSVTAHVPTGTESKMLTIHRDAILRNDVGSFVYTVMPGAEGQPASAVPVQVEVLFQTQERSVVSGGRLQAGTQLVIEGNERLFPMAPIRPIAERSKSGAAEGAQR